MAQLVIRVPDSKSPGFPRRLRKAAEFQRRTKLEGGFTPDLIDEIIAFLAEYVEGDNIKEQTDLMWDCSEEQFYEMLSAIGGGGREVPPALAQQSNVPTDGLSQEAVLTTS